MAIRLKTDEQIERMRRAGRVVRQVLDRLGEMIAPGMTTEELDAEAERLCLNYGGECLFKGVPGRGGAGPFPGAICVSLNEQVVHGIPSKDTVIRAGDIVSVDFGVKLDNWCGDAAETFLVGKVPDQVRHLVNVTRNSLAIAVRMSRHGEKWSNVAAAMQSYVEDEGFSVVREFVGHGIGAEMHEEPKVPNFVSSELEANDIVLKEGMTLAVEPMVNMGLPAVQYAEDGWTVLTQDHLPSAHFEHTLAITANGVDVLTDGR
ncbi:MAG: type I methionyl aminopeptidase [Planctomycetota bacterium]|nr:type I methionyl aminopeptidase [Planctomycetota bacterium]